MSPLILITLALHIPLRSCGFRVIPYQSLKILLLTPTVNHTPWSTVQETRRMSPANSRLSLPAVVLLGLSLTDKMFQYCVT